MATVSWNSVSGSGITYALRADRDPSSWNGSCNPSTGSGDYCQDSLSGTSQTISTSPGYTYQTWVHAVNSGGWSNPANTSFTCAAPAPVVTMNLSPTTIAYGGTYTSASYSATNNPTSCILTTNGADPTSLPVPSYTFTPPPSPPGITSTQNFTITCTNGGGSGSASKTLTVLPSTNYTVSTRVSAGTGSFSPTSRSVAKGENTFFSISAGSGYIINAVSLSNDNAVGSGSCASKTSCVYTVSNVQGNTAVSASFTSTSCTLPWGGTIANRATVTAYQSSSVSSGNACVSETRTCLNGTLSGSFQYQSCSVAQPGPPSAPAVSVSVSPSSVTTPDPFTVTMSSTNATSCTWSRTGSYSGNWTNQPVPAPNTSYNSGPLAWPSGNATWTFTCVNASGSNSASGSVTVNAAPLSGVNGACAAAHYNCSAGTSTNNQDNPTDWTWSCQGSGGGSTASCSEQKVLSCTLPWGGTIANGQSVTAYQVPSVTAPTTCASVSQTRTCTNGTLSGSYTNQNCSSNSPAPTAILSANPTTINSGQSSTLTWSSTNATSCTAAGGFSTGNATSGNTSTGALSSTQNYQISCSGPGGSTLSNIVTVTVIQPQVAISADPSRVRVGDTSSISWSASNVTSCTVTDPSGTKLASGNADNSNNFSKNSPYTATITSQSTFTIACKTDGGGPDVTSSVTVNIIPIFQEF